MENIEAKSLNLAILPTPGVTDLAISLSQRVGQNFPTEFTLDRESFMPHITVYQAHFPVENITKVRDELRRVVSGTAPFKVKLEGFVISHDTFLFWRCGRSVDLQRLHQEVVQRVNFLRDGLVLPHLAQVTGLTEEDQADMQNYGALLIGPRFNPHLTITRLSEPNDAESAINSLRKVNNKVMFEVKELILGYLGPNGTVNGVVETFKFGK